MLICLVFSKVFIFDCFLAGAVLFLMVDVLVSSVF